MATSPLQRLRQLIDRLLKRTSESFGVDLVHYGKHLTWYLIGHAATILRSLVTSVLLAYLLSRDELGQIRYVIALFGIVSLFGLPGLPAIVTLAAAKKEHGTIRDAIRQSLCWGSLGSLGLLLWAVYRASVGHDPNVAWIIASTALILPLSLYGNFAYPILQGKEQAKKLNGLVVLNSLLVSAATVAAALLHTGTFGVALALLGTDALFRAIVTRLTVTKLQGDVRGDALLTFSKSWNRINIFQYFAFQIDQLILQWAGGYHRLSTYYIATMVPDQFKDLYGNLLSVLTPRITRTEHNLSYAKGLWRNFWKVMAVCLLTIIFFILIAPWIMPLVFPKYPDAVLPAQIYMLSFLVFPATILQAYFQARHQSRPLKTIAIVSGITMIILTSSLIPVFGLWGAIAAKSLTRVVTLIVSAMLFLGEMKTLKHEASGK